MKYALRRIYPYGHIFFMVETFTALAEPSRFRIVELLREGPCSVNEIGQRLALKQPQVSKHLRVLRKAGLVSAEPRAQQRLYALEPGRLRQLHDWLERYRRLWDERFTQLDELLEELKQEKQEEEQSDDDGRK